MGETRLQGSRATHWAIGLISRDAVVPGYGLNGETRLRGSRAIHWATGLISRDTVVPGSSRHLVIARADRSLGHRVSRSLLETAPEMTGEKHLGGTVKLEPVFRS